MNTYLNPPNYHVSDNFMKSCANCRHSRFVRMRDGSDDLRCTEFDFSFGNTSECDPQDNASEHVCDRFKR